MCFAAAATLASQIGMKTESLSISNINPKMKMNMKKIISWGVMLAAAFTLTNCAKEIDAPVQEPESNGYPFEIIASTVDTKTVNDGMSTKWAEDDQINVFHALGESTEYVNDGAFTISDVEAGIFTGTINEELDVEEEYDWYVLYPYNAKVTTPGSQTSGYTYIGYSTGLNQTGYNSMASLKGSVCPLYGIAKYAGVRPEITMNHLSSIVAINVTNKNEEPLTITEASFTATEDIVGSYYIDITGESVVYTPSDPNYVKNTALVKVSGGTALEQGESAILYAAIKPFTAAASQKLTLSVNGYSKEIELTKDVTFTAGKIKTLNFGYDKEVSEATGIALPWVEDFSSKDLSKYVIVNGASDTKLYTTATDNLAGGQAPEILIGKTNGSMTATIATGGFNGDLTLVFKSNHADDITVTAPGVTIKKVNDSEYTLTVPEGLSTFDVTLKNATGSNARVDDIELAKTRLSQTLAFETALYEFETGSDELIAFTGQVVSGNETEVTYSSNNVDVAEVDATTGKVTMTGESGTAVITATAAKTEDYNSAIATYTIVVTNPSATIVEKTVTYNFGTDTEVKFSSWDSSYKQRIANYADATVTFKSANKQSQTITDCPVTKGQDVTIVMGDNRTLKSFNLTLKKWSSKPQTVTLHYSTDGGSTYTKTNTTSSTFALAAEVPEGTNAIKFTFSSTSNQVGIVSCELTFEVAE